MKEISLTWLRAEVDKLGITWAYVKGLIGRIWDGISIWKGIGGNKRVVRDILTPPYLRIKNFVGGIATKVKEFVLKGALKLAGAPVEMVMGVLNKGKGVFAKILDDPIGFIKNLFTGMGNGLRGFMAKIGDYLSGGLKDWILGKLAENGIAVPETWDLKGIFGLVTQVVGVTYQNIRAKVVEKLGPKGEEMVGKMEQAVAFVKDLITKGPIALWEKVKESLSNIKEVVIGGIKSFIQQKVIKEGITFILGMLNPAGALVKAVQLLVRLINFLRENMERIASFVKRVFDSVVNIANGDLSGAAKMIEGALSKAVPIFISLAARLLGLGNLAKKIQEIIMKIGQRVREAVNKVITWLVEKAKKLWQGVASRLGIGGKEEGKEDGEDEKGAIRLKEKVQAATVPSPQIRIELGKGESLDSVVQKKVAPIQMASSHVFRADDHYQSGMDIGVDLDSEEANEMDVQEPHSHVLEKETGETSRFVSFSLAKVIKTASGSGGPKIFTKKNKIFKVAWTALLELEKEGVIKI